MSQCYVIKDKLQKFDQLLCSCKMCLIFLYNARQITMKIDTFGEEA